MIKKSLLWCVLLMAILSVGALLYFHFGAGRGDFQLLVLGIQKQGAMGMVFFFLIYLTASLVFLPLSILSLSGGIIYGFLPGFILVLSAMVVSAGLSFLLSRYLLRNWIRQKIKHKPSIQALMSAAEKKGWRIVALSRLTFIFPFTLLNCSFGTTRIGLLEYVLATAVAMAPVCALQVYLGNLAGGFVGLQPGGEMSRLEVIAAVISFIASAGFVGYLAYFGFRALREKYRVKIV